VSLQEGNGLALDAAGKLYWDRNIGHQLMRFANNSVTLLAGQPAASRDVGLTALLGIPPGPQPATGIPLGFPAGIVFDKAGNLLLADGMAGRIYKVSGIDGTAPTIEVLAGRGIAAMTGDVANGVTTAPQDDGKPATEATFYIPLGLAFDPDGNLYVSEAGTAQLGVLASNYASLQTVDLSLFPKVGGRVRKISAKDGTITTVAGLGSRNFGHPTSPEDALLVPSGLAYDPRHGLAVMDTGANLVHVLPPEALTTP